MTATRTVEPVVLRDTTVVDLATDRTPRAWTSCPRRRDRLWCGEEEAAQFVKTTVEETDASGRLDAVRSNRVQDDFSEYWSNARADFERKLYRTRNRGLLPATPEARFVGVSRSE